MRIIQMLPSMAYGDAIGNYTLAIRNIIKESGYQTEIYAQNIDRRFLFGTVKKIEKIPRLDKNDIIIYHASTGTKMNFDLPSFPAKKIMIYHNITPPHYFKGYSEAARQLTEYGYQGIQYLSDKVDYCIADSEYNKKDLLKMGYQCPIDVCPVLVPFCEYNQKPDNKIIKRYSNDGYTNLLFVGRIAPNKKQEDVINIFSVYHRLYNPKSRLFLVGNSSGMERYESYLRKQVEQFGLDEEVVFTGHIKFRSVLSYYHIASVFVCMSEHEGFCVPILEAMNFDIPIIAYDGGAVSETLGNTGLLLETKSDHNAASLVNQVTKDTHFRAAIVRNQHEHLNEFDYNKTKQRLFKCLERAIS